MHLKSIKGLQKMKIVTNQKYFYFSWHSLHLTLTQGHNQGLQCQIYVHFLHTNYQVQCNIDLPLALVLHICIFFFYYAYGAHLTWEPITFPSLHINANLLLHMVHFLITPHNNFTPWELDNPCILKIPLNLPLSLPLFGWFHNRVFKPNLINFNVNNNFT